MATYRGEGRVKAYQPDAREVAGHPSCAATRSAPLLPSLDSITDFRRRPIDGYLHLLLATHHDLVFHIDGDMMFGGGSQTWMAEALDQLSRRPELLACNPLPSPPRADGKLLSQRGSPTPELGAPYV